MPNRTIDSIYLDSETFDVLDHNAERAANKVGASAFNGNKDTASDIKYPSEKAVATKLYDKEDKANKVSSWSGNPDNTRYPTEKLVKDSIDAVSGSKFDSSSVVTEWGTPPANGHVPSEKLVKDTLDTKQTVANKVTAFQGTPDDAHYPSEKLVKESLDTKQTISNKVTSFQGTPDDTHYPSEKLVKDSLDTKQTIANKVTSFQGTPDHAHYPSEKLVKDSLYALENEVKTVVVEELPAIGSAVETVNYILKNGDNGLLYKKVNSAWMLISGSKASVLEELPESGDEFTDYYVPNEHGIYIHYRWDATESEFFQVGASGYTNAEIDAALQLKEAIANKVTSWSGTTSDTKYPSEKLVKDSLDAKQDVANLRTSFQTTPDDTHYPSEKLVSDSLAALQTTLEGEIVGNTKVVTALPAVGSADANASYVLKKGNGALLYRVIDGAWKMIGGAMVSVVNELPEDGNGDPLGDSFTDYYLATSDPEVYLHYRWMDAVGNTPGYFYAIGADSYSKSQVDGLLSAIRSDHATDINGVNTTLGQLSRAIETNAADIDALEAAQSEYALSIVQDNETYYLRLIENEDEENPVSSVALPATGGGGGGQGSGTTLTVERVTQSPVSVTPTDNVIIQIRFSSVDGDNQTVDGSYTLKLGSTIIMSGPLQQGLNSFDVTSYCTVGTQKFMLTVTDEGGAVNVKSWTVQVIDVRIESSFSDRYTYAIGQAVNFTYTPYGSVSKTVHFKLDGIELTPVVTGVSGILQSFSIPAQSHGAHSFECWITATVNDVSLETDHIYKDIIWFDSASDYPVIGCIYRYDKYGQVQSRQYDSLNIPYVVFDPTTPTPQVTLEADGVVVNSLQLTSAFNTWSYKSSEVQVHMLTIRCRTVAVQLRVQVNDIGYNIQPVTANLAFDFNPAGYSNGGSNRLWADANDPNIAMTVSENFDWSNGGYRLDEDGNPYFSVRSGTRAYISYDLFGADPKQAGAEFKVIFRVENVQESDAQWLTCLSNDETDSVGLEMKAHEASYHSATDTLLIQYSEDDTIEYEYNVNPIDQEDGSAESFVMAYEDGVGARVLTYNNSARLHQYEPTLITIGSDKCDVRIYRMKAYTSALTDSNILSNFIADARDAETIIARYERNQIYDENNNLTPESVAQACPDLKVIKISCPHFTNDKKDYVKGTNVECIHVNGDSVLDNWTWTNGYHAGQGTTSNAYGYAGRNIDIIFGFNGTDQVLPTSGNYVFDDTYVSSLTLGDGTRRTGSAAKVALTRGSVPNTWFNIKVNIASSENANNALLQKRYNDYLPYKTPRMRMDSKVKNSMEFVNCVVFIRETDPDLTTHREFNDTGWHFYAIGNIGDSKKTDNTRVNDPQDMDEFVVEISDNTLPNAYFDTGVYLDSNGAVTYTEENKASIVSPISRAQWDTITGYTAVTDPALLIAKNLPILYENSGGSYVRTSDTAINSEKTYYMANYLNKKYRSLFVNEYKYNSTTGKTSQTSGWDTSFEFRYDMGTRDGETVSDAMAAAQQEESKQVWRNMYEFVIMSSDADFVQHFGDWFITESYLYWYLFTERYAMIDNRAKNTFWHWGKTYITDAEATALGDDAAYYTIDNSAAVINNGYRFDLWDYDNDSALGIDNNGELNLTYGYEDIDKKPNGQPIFNAHDSVIWARIRSLMGSQLQQMYRSRESMNCWSASSLINEFDNWQEQFPEELWRLDIERKYLRTYYGGDQRFLENMMNGRKRYQRRQFERDQETYIGTKYFGTNQCSDGEAIMIRCNTPSGVTVTPNYTIRLVPYSDMYLSVAYGNNAPQQVRAKAGQEYTFTTSMSVMNDTAILIHCAKNIQAVNNLSACYIRANSFAKAVRLKTLVIGSNVPGYSNQFITELILGNLPLLQTLDIRNCPNLTGELNLSAFPNLKELYATGTGITGVTFATNGKIQNALLPESLVTLTMRELHYLTGLHIAGYSNLETLISEHCTNDPYTIINAALSSLRTVQALGVDWTFSDTTFLNAIAGLYSSTLSGTATIGGSIRVSEINAYAEKWPELLLLYDSSRIIQQHTVIYKNPDETELCRTAVDRFAYPPNPVTAGLLAENPTMEPDDQYTYTFMGWSGLSTQVISDMTVYATYTGTTRQYTVKWFARATDLVPLYTTNAYYGDEAVYEGNIPTYTDDEYQNVFRLFKGWDKSTGYVRGDMNVYATYAELDLNSASQSLASMGMENMGALELYAVTTTKSSSSLFEVGDYTDVQLGYNPEFVNVESVEIANEEWFDGSPRQANVKLFAPDTPSWVLAIDYEFYDEGCASGDCLLSCIDPQYGTGFKLTYYKDFSNPDNSQQRIDWNGVGVQTIGRSGRRNIIVIRHIKGENTYIVYTNHVGTTDYDANVISYAPYGSLTTEHEGLLTLGSTAQVVNGQTVYSAENCAAGWVHWAKVWFDDLGATECTKIANWPHVKNRISFIGNRRQHPANDGQNFCDASFVMSPLEHVLPYTSSRYQWEGSNLQAFFENRVFKAFPQVWQSAIKNVQVVTKNGVNVNDSTVSLNHLYALSHGDIIDVSSELGGYYLSEVSAPGNAPCSFFATAFKRLAFPGIILEDRDPNNNVRGRRFFSGGNDPTLTNQCSDGDVWYQNNNYIYIFVSAATALRHTYIGNYRLTSASASATQGTVITARGTGNNGGYWLSCYDNYYGYGGPWWNRTPAPSSNNYYYYSSYQQSGQQRPGSYRAALMPSFSM